MVWTSQRRAGKTILGLGWISQWCGQLRTACSSSLGRSNTPASAGTHPYIPTHRHMTHKLKIIKSWDWGDGSVVKSTCCSCRCPGVLFPTPTWWIRTIQFQRMWHLFWHVGNRHAHMRCTGMYAGNTPIHIKQIFKNLFRIINNNKSFSMTF